MERMSSAATYTASGGAIILGLTANDLAILIGVAIAALTFLVNVWFRWQTLQVVKKAASEKKVTLEVGGE